MDITEHLEREGFTLQEYHEDSWLIYILPGTILTASYSTVSGAFLFRSPSTEGISYVYYYGGIESVNELKFIVKLVKRSYDQRKDSPIFFPPEDIIEFAS